MNISNRILWSAAIVLFAIVAAVAVIKVQPMLNPEVLSVAPLDAECDLRAGPCTSKLPDGKTITLSIAPDDIPLVKPLTLNVQVTGAEPKFVEVDFVGLGMDMGFNRPKLQSDATGGFEGKGMLPVCIRDAMEWEAKVLITTDEGIFAAPYRFITVKPGVTLPGSKQE